MTAHNITTPAIDIERARREGLRWLILLTLNNARPIGASDALILTVAHAQQPDATLLALRRELDYLDGRGLIHLTRAEGAPWAAKLTRHGIDVAEYTVPCEAGIARPAKYW